MSFWIDQRRHVVAALALLVVGCSADDGSAGDAGQVDCASELKAYAEAAASNQSCSTDSDCTFYASPCLAAQAGNCAGIVYVNESAEAAIEPARSAYEQCSGLDCVNGGSCGLGPAQPACVDQVCVGANP